MVHNEVVFVLLLPLLAAPHLTGCVVEPGYGVLLDEDSLSCPDFTLVLEQELVGAELVSNTLTQGSPSASYVGPGLALLDLDDDGDLDVAFGTGSSDTRLLVSDDGWLSVTDEVLPRAAALAAGDIDGDGTTELFLGRGEGLSDEVVFLDGRPGLVIPDSEGHTTGGSFADLDGDGDLDLAISRHVEVFEPSQVAAGAVVGGGNAVLRNDGDGFTVLPEALPAGLRDATSFQVLWLHADDDGVPDLYWVNDFGWWTWPNTLLLGDGEGGFIEQSGSGADLATATMGVSAGDVSGDGRIDLWASDAGAPDLLLSDGPAMFYEAGQATGASVAASSERVTSWGTSIADLDLDGRPDLLAAYGPINFFSGGTGEDSVVLSTGETLDDVGLQRSLLLHQQPDGTFSDHSGETDFSAPGIQRSVLRVDLDGDGRPEVLSTGWLDAEQPFLRVWRVEGGCTRGLTVRLADLPRGKGARVTAVIGDRAVLRPLSHGAAFSSGSLETSLALGASDTVSALTITLPDGTTFTAEDLEPGLLVVEP